MTKINRIVLTGIISLEILILIYELLYLGEIILQYIFWHPVMPPPYPGVKLL